MKKSTLFISIALSILLSACSLPIQNSTPSSGQVATQVSAILTSMPTPSPFNNPTQAILPSASPSPEPSNTPVTPTSTVPAPTMAPATATQTELPTMTQTVAASPTLSSSDPLSKLGNPTWQDTFQNDLNWPTGDNEFSSIKIENGQLVLTSLSKLDGWRLAFAPAQNYYLEASLKSDNCSGSDHFGLIVRVPDPKTADNGYLFGITCDGQYSIRKWNGTKMTYLVNWTATDVLSAGAGKTNRLGVLAIGNHLSLYLNGKLIVGTQDSSYSTGYFGVFVGGNNTPNLSVTLTSIAFWENPPL